VPPVSTALRLLPTPRHRPKLPRAGAAPFLIVHALPLLAFVTGVTVKAVVLGVVLYVVRMFCITAGYHRYFAHRAYRLGRFPQFLLALGGASAAQKGPLWWAANHRDHHRYADTDRDPHSPQKGFWWAHVGWVLSGDYGTTDVDRIEDFARFPELRWLNDHDWVAPWALGVASFLIAGWSGLVVGFFASTVVLWHVTFSVNSVTHVFGWRRYGTTDSSRNNPLVAVLTMGEGWHNNHHHYPLSARQGFRWWELDLTYLLLRAGAAVGIVRDMKRPPREARDARRIKTGHFDVGRFRQHLSRAAAVLPADDSAAELRDLLAGAAVKASPRARAG
jgi:stearoyl-CoA desaturase (delta-9 desaturase)